ncbi:uncharacterized protein LOC141902809 [Tubulanus polymorphus]|uniref:uncharacterized protein LOC141902809 n=1 Tax=Tubulanus polymorphus TaxID=672921 RepID=UPI003DA62FDD
MDFLCSRVFVAVVCFGCVFSVSVPVGLAKTNDETEPVRSGNHCHVTEEWYYIQVYSGTLHGYRKCCVEIEGKDCECDGLQSCVMMGEDTPDNLRWSNLQKMVHSKK